MYKVDPSKLNKTSTKHTFDQSLIKEAEALAKAKAQTTKAEKLAKASRIVQPEGLKNASLAPSRPR